MSEVTYSKLQLVYNNNETIISNGFTMTSNFITPLLHRMKNEKILNSIGFSLVQIILSHKHTSENPFPSVRVMSELLAVTEKNIKDGIKAIKEAGILAISKVGRKNTYDFTPFFELLEKFIVEYKSGNKSVNVSDLMKKKVVRKKSETDFSTVKKGEETVIIDTNEETIEEVAEEVVHTTLTDKIEKVLKANKVSEQDSQAVAELYEAYGEDLGETLFIEKIMVAGSKDNFLKFFKVCINNAFKNGEKPQEAPVTASKTKSGTKAPIRTEKLPTWFDGEENKVKETTETVPDIETAMFQATTLEELLAMESECLAIPDLVDSYNSKKSIFIDREAKKEGAK
jgi:hypothetical protein